MTKILRNALLAAVAVSGVAGSALAGQQQPERTCSNTPYDKVWYQQNCLFGGSHDHEDHSRES